MVDSAHANGASLRLSRTRSASCTASGTQLELWLYKVNSIPNKHRKAHGLKGFADLQFFFFCVISGAGPHPKALSGRVICCTWWFFSIVLLACYFSNLRSSKTSESTQLKVKGFDDLANQNVIEYGCLAGSSTLAFFKVLTVWALFTGGKVSEAQFSGVLNEAVIKQSWILLCFFTVDVTPIFRIVFPSLQNSNDPLYRRIYEHMERTKSFVSSMDEGVRRAKEGNYAFIGESVSLDLAVARHCELVRAHEVVGMRGYSIAAPIGEAVQLKDGSVLQELIGLNWTLLLPQDSPFIKSLNIAILQLNEAGELSYLRSKWWASSCLAEGAQSSAAQPHSLKGMFLVLSIGLGLGAAVAVLELFSKSRRSAAEQKVPLSCSILVL